MTLVKATNPKKLNAVWRFSHLDVNCLKMVIKGLWIYDISLDENELKVALGKILDFYPHLSGRVHNETEINMNNEGVLFSVKHKNDLNISAVQQIKNPHNYFNAGINIPEFIKGEFTPLSVQLTHLKDGCVLSIHCAHVCLDGEGFSTFVNNWSKIVKKEPIGEVLLELPADRLALRYSKEEATRLAVSKQWYHVGLTALLQLVWQKITKIPARRSTPIFLSKNLMRELKQCIETRGGKKYSSNTILSALLVKLCHDLNGFKTNKAYAIVTVVNLRDRLKGINRNYVGNAITNITTPKFQSDLKLEEIAAIVNDTLKSFFEADDDKLEKHVQLNMATAGYKLPYVPFDLVSLNASRPTCLYVNNLNFPMYECDFGKKEPLYSCPNDLPDLVKLCPSTPHTPGIDIYFGGYLAKSYNKIKNKRAWLMNILKRENLLG